MPKLAFLFFLFSNFWIGIHALIVSPAASQDVPTNVFDNVNPSQAAGQEKSSMARIRSTRPDDLEPVADLLSSAITGNNADTTNWKARMERLRVKSSLQNTLHHRIQALEEGKKHLSQSIGTTYGEGISLQIMKDPHHLWYLWSQESFRKRIQQAAEVSTEPHPWGNHDFELAPTDPRWLRHEMITAQDVESGEIIGFCEIAMLLCPPPTVASAEDNYNNNMDFTDGDNYYNNNHAFDCCSVDCAPTIANLVVAKHYRRRGIAKGLVKSAERIVARKWQCDELGLYVEKENSRAMDLYYRTGYDVKAVSGSKWYMSKALD